MTLEAQGAKWSGLQCPHPFFNQNSLSLSCVSHNISLGSAEGWGKRRCSAAKATVGEYTSEEEAVQIYCVRRGSQLEII